MKKPKKTKPKTRKKAKKKVTKKAKRRTRKEEIYIQGGLHAKKREIMAAVPVMPCSVIGRDRQGLRFAHTQAEHVFQRYSKLCRENGLVITMVDCKMETLPFPFQIPEDKITDLLRDVNFTNLWPWTRAVCTFEIMDTGTGQTERFMGAGLGNNDVWADNSAQTVAFKQALIMYFFTAWPQPTDYLKLIRESLEQVQPTRFVDALQEIMPKNTWEIMEKSGAIKALRAFFGG